MSDRARFEATLVGFLESNAPHSAPGDLAASVVQATRNTRPLPAWRARLAVPVMRTESVVLVGSSVARLAFMGAMLLVLAIPIGVGGIVVGSGLLRGPGPDGPGAVPTPIVAPSPPPESCSLPPTPADTLATTIQTDGGRPTVVFAGCSYWIGSSNSNVVQRIDPITNEVTGSVSVAALGWVADLAVQSEPCADRQATCDDEVVWASIVASPPGEPGEQHLLVGFDPTTTSVTFRIAVPAAVGEQIGAIWNGNAWLYGFSGLSRYVHLDPGHLGTIGTPDPEWSWPFYLGMNALWSPGLEPGTVVRFAPDLSSTIIQIPVEGDLQAVSDSGLWIVDLEARTTHKVSPEGELLLTLDNVRVSEASGGYVYGGPPGWILRIDDATGAVIERFPISLSEATLLTAAGDSVWAWGSDDPNKIVRYQLGQGGE